MRCVASACVIPADGCRPGFKHCTSDPNDGCETDLSDPKNCGDCRKTCDVANGLSQCKAGACTPAACRPGFRRAGATCVACTAMPPEIAKYDGSLGVTIAFVQHTEQAAGVLQWKSDLGLRHRDPGNVAGVRFCGATLIADDLVLTAGRCLDGDDPVSGWVWPRESGMPKPIAPDRAARELQVSFTYRANPAVATPQPVAYAVKELVEHRLGGVDFALLRLEKPADAAIERTMVFASDADVGDRLAVIGNPAGDSKKIEAGVLQVSDGALVVASPVSLGGMIGAGMLHVPTEALVGVQTGGECEQSGAGLLRGVPISTILAASPTLRALASPGHLFFYRRAPSGQGVGAVYRLARDGTLTRTWSKPMAGNWRLVAAASPSLLVFYFDGWFARGILDPVSGVYEEKKVARELWGGHLTAVNLASYALLYSWETGTGDLLSPGIDGQVVNSLVYEGGALPPALQAGVTSEGHVLFYDAGKRSGVAAVFRPIDRRFTKVKNYDPGQLDPWTQLVSAGRGRLFLYDAASGSGTVATLNDKGDLAMSKKHDAIGVFSHVAAGWNGLVFLLNATDGSAQSIVFAPDGSLEVLKRHSAGSFQADGGLPWDMVVGR